MRSSANSSFKCERTSSLSFKISAVSLFSSSKWKIKEIQVNRAINSNSKNRTGHSEILVKNY